MSIVSLLRSPYATHGFYSFCFQTSGLSFQLQVHSKYGGIGLFSVKCIYVVYLIEGSDSLSGRTEIWIERKAQ